MREIQIARERIKELELENAKLVAEHDTLRYIVRLFMGSTNLDEI